ncbi:hypothetical protein KAFR_0C05600 [Kazachstania africana CBS 2517]|uniref:Homeobox domain-containing protein n=1 Tax=Kazachstania africana (strain ATCC 22294 / BCRC 22015 / CBS 2517 / CECT 1963 / NBRC 1671 / NRRL Y-8276) TaxID=1071382 RepID=H2AT51_KAZAF|nr:hypothetical protein KAFR_0C05600 [Kazachstania africana CBS 2517]CCF57551.1 hypothetical protein KAFR_0C05600 [Kazachstania africana CBS 2517]
MSTSNHSLPSLSMLLSTDSILPSPIDSFPTKFRTDDHGIIRLPPLSTNAGHNTRPKPLESALRHSSDPLPTPTPELEPKNALRNDMITTLQSPATPVVKNHDAKRINSMITPLTAARDAITPSSNDKKRAFAFITHSQETFGVKEPKIDNAPLARRKRRRTSTQELNILQASFDKCPTPDKKERLELADRCNMTEKAVQIWFQNKRQAVKRAKLAMTTKSNTSIDNSSISDSNTSMNLVESTPLATKVASAINNYSKSASTSSVATDAQQNLNKTPKIYIPYCNTKCGDTTPIRKSTLSRDSSPIRRSPTPNTSRVGQALTFHLKSDKKILTPVKTSPNNKVNKLINGYSSSVDEKNLSPNRKGKLEFRTAGQGPLKELSTNIV